jgi:RHS repeat-associated protein
VYDAENKMTAAQDSYAGWSYYSYNADGQRIRRKINNQETWQIYGLGGELLAEYAANGPAATPQKEYGYRNSQLLITAEGGPSGLVGRWNFDENSGTAASDSSGSGYTGTLTSGAGWNVGQNGSAVSLDGVNDYVQVGAQSSLVMTSAASLSAWIYPTGAGSDATYGGAIVVKEGEYVIARYPNGTIQWGFANSNPGWSFINTGYVAPLNQWTHLAVTYDNGTIKTYANGTLVHTYNGSGAIGDAITGQNDFRIGGRQAISQHFQGRIDDVRVYNRALTASEVNLALNGASNAVNWLVADHLGTPRMIIDKTGTLANIKRHDYLPFGEELFAGTGGRSSANGYIAGDGVRQQFTEKERDIETGLDYFINRYYSSIQGRFMSSDPTLLSAHGVNPQTWNRYSYVTNRPLGSIDPFGLWGYNVEDIKDKNGKVTGERFIFVKTKNDDNAASLLNQLGYKSGTKEGDKLLKSIEKQLGEGETVKGAKLSGIVGRAFKIVDEGLSAQATTAATSAGGPIYKPLNDCSMTTFRAAFPWALSQYGGAGLPDFDTDSGDTLLTSSMNTASTRSGDIVRYGKDAMIGGQLRRNHATHFMSVLFTGDDGVTQAFSRSGVNGRFEIVPVDQFNGTNYGRIQGKQGDASGFYRPNF